MLYDLLSSHEVQAVKGCAHAVPHSDMRNGGAVICASGEQVCFGRTGSEFGVANRSQKGFSLVELMIVVVIAAIISAIALPSYRNYVTRSKIPDALSTLASKRVQIEQFFQDNHTYAGAPACNNDTTSSPYFTFACVGALDANNYTLQATGGNGANQSMAGFSYTLNQTNTKTSTIVAPATATWIATNPTCWITKTGGQC